MSGINKVIIVGRLGKDPEVRYSNTGDAIANLSVATSETWKDKQTGEKKEKTEWHRVVIFGKLAEIAGQYLKKGSNIYVEGKLQTRKWQNQQGQDQYSTEIVLQGYGGVMQVLDSSQGGQAQQPKRQPQQQGMQPQAQPIGGQQYAPQQQDNTKLNQGGFTPNIPHDDEPPF